MLRIWLKNIEQEIKINHHMWMAKPNSRMDFIINLFFISKLILNEAVQFIFLYLPCYCSIYVPTRGKIGNNANFTHYKNIH